VAIAAAAFICWAIFGPLDSQGRLVLLCAAGAFGLGLFDDIRRLSPASKLVGQVAIAAALVAGGVRVEIVNVPAIAFVLTILWVVGLMNAVNLIDNMDGLAAGVAAIAAAVLAIVAIPSTPTAAAIAAITAGIAVGFLVHNFPPARIFMGDAGSLLLGFLLAAVALLETASDVSNVGFAVLGPLFVLAVPIFDTMLVTASRRFAGIPVSQGGRDHTSHRLAALGLSERAVVLVLYGVAAAFAVVGLAARVVFPVFLALSALAVAALALFGVFLYDVDVYRKRGSAVSADTVTGGRLTRAASLSVRFGAEVGLDVLLLTTAYYVSYLVRFEGLPAAAWLDLFIPSLPLVVAIQLGAFVATGVYRTLWRYVGLSDAVVILRATALGTAAAMLAIVIEFRFSGYSRAVFVLDGVLAATLVFGARGFLVWLRHWFSSRPRADDRRVLIVGASDYGELALRLLRRTPGVSYRPVGFLDDDPGKWHRRIGGVPIVGPVGDFDDVVRRLNVDYVVVALDRAAARDPVRERCEALGISFREFSVTE
jgi:UDP-GlcNAc:undecaprenyl-phosphate GlcNAc-1-phosphate transferase